jgi:hypothetical protein
VSIESTALLRHALGTVHTASAACVGECHPNRRVHVCTGPVVVAIVKNVGLVSHGQWRRVSYLPAAAQRHSSSSCH